jgi:uncharacterized repeat protein (TIGR04138 family)
MDNSLEAWEKIASEVGISYPALHFLLAALQEARPYHQKPPTTDGSCHVSAFEFCCAFMNLAQRSFGADYAKWLHGWNLDTSEKVGAVVFALIEKDLMRRQDGESQSDFENIFYID